MKMKSKSMRNKHLELWHPGLIHRVCASIVIFAAAAIYCRFFAWSDGWILPSVWGTLATGLIVGLIFISFAFLRQIAANRLAEDLIYLAAETAHEAGPDQRDVIRAGQTFAQLLDFFSRVRLRGLHRWVCCILLINPGQLQRMLGDASDVINHNERLDQIRRASIPISAFCEHCYESYGGLLHRLSYRVFGVGSAAKHEVEEAIQEFIDRVDAMALVLTFDVVKEACLASRKAGFLTHCAGPYVISIDRLTQFRDALTKCEAQMRDLLAVDPQHENPLDSYIESIRRRREAVIALIQDEPEELWRILTRPITAC